MNIEPSNKRTAPMSQESLDLIRATVSSAIELHNAPSFPRSHIGILKNILEFLDDLKQVFDRLGSTAKSFKELAVQLGAAILALKELCDMLNSKIN